MRLKGIIRNQRGNAIEPSKTSPARIVIVDPTDKEIHSSPVTISESGSFDFTYTLPTGKTGTHSIRLEYPEELAQAEALEDQWEKQEAILASARFEMPLRVEEFRRNAFEVGQTIAAPAPGATSISSELTAKYYQGQPVAAGKVKYFSRVTAQNPYPERFRDFLFGNHRSDDWTYWYHYFGYRSDDEEELRQRDLADPRRDPALRRWQGHPHRRHPAGGVPHRPRSRHFLGSHRRQQPDSHLHRRDHRPSRVRLHRRFAKSTNSSAPATALPLETRRHRHRTANPSPEPSKSPPRSPAR